jgi:hypothetical protein
MDISKDYLHFSSSATIGEVLRAYLDRQGQWWWLLTTEMEGQYFVCSFGSLLPYLTGRTTHIVHSIGHCPVCSSMDPVVWRDTGALVEEALADQATCSRLVSDLPMAELPVAEAENVNRFQASGVIENGVFCGVYVPLYMGVPGGPPDF